MLTDALTSRLNGVLFEQIIYEELMYHHQRLQSDTQSLVYFFSEHSIDISCGILMGSFNLDTATDIATTQFHKELSKLSPKAAKLASSKQQNLIITISNMKAEFIKLHTRSVVYILIYLAFYVLLKFSIVLLYNSFLIKYLCHIIALYSCNILMNAVIKMLQTVKSYYMT